MHACAAGEFGAFEALLGRTGEGPTAFGTTGFGPRGAVDAPGLLLETLGDEARTWTLTVDGPPVAHVAWRSATRDFGLQFSEADDAPRGWRYHLRYRGPERWSGEAIGLSVEGGSIAEYTGNAAPATETEVPGELVLQLSREALDLAFAVERDRAVAAKGSGAEGGPGLTLTIAVGTRRVEFDLEQLAPGAVGRGAGWDESSASIQLWSLGPDVPSDAGLPDAGPPRSGTPGAAPTDRPQRFEWTPPADARGELIYARVAFADGSAAWSPVRRAR